MRLMICYLKETFFIPLMIVLLLIGGFILDTPLEIFKGYFEIIKSPSILITDYIEVGGIGATLFNVSTIMIFNLIILHFLKLKMNGVIFSGFMSIAGFAFFGKNLLNSLPIYLGLILYSKINRFPFRSMIITVLFSTGISPLVSYSMFGLGLPLYGGIPLGIAAGIIVGLVIPSLAAHTIKFHHGYNLYNTGFALGIISAIFYGAYKAFNLEVKTVLLISTDYHYLLLFILLGLSLFFILFSIISDHGVFKKYLIILKKSGRLVTDFSEDTNNEAVMLNVGFIGLLCISFVLIFKIEITGPIFGTIITIMGFAGSGLHIYNTFFVLVGSISAIYLTHHTLNEQSMVLAVLFSTGLAPITSKYTPFAGMLAGFIHIIVSPLMINFQGGFDLYNNGFAAGFVACVVIVIIEAFKRDLDKEIEQLEKEDVDVHEEV